MTEYFFFPQKLYGNTTQIIFFYLKKKNQLAFRAYFALAIKNVIGTRRVGVAVAPPPPPQRVDPLSS